MIRKAAMAKIDPEIKLMAIQEVLRWLVEDYI